MDWSLLFEASLLVFTIPMFVAVVVGALGLVGLFDVEALDLDLDLDADADVDVDVGADVGADVDGDVDVDADADGGGSGWMQFLGFGAIPLSLFLVIVCFSFGWIGLLLVSLFGSTVAGVVGAGMATSLMLAAPALVGALALAAPTARLLAPLFRDYGRADRADTLVGSIAVLSTTRVTPSFGSATVTLPDRGPVEVSVRTTNASGDDLGYGDEVVIFDYDAEHNLYYVAPVDAEVTEDV